MIIFRNQGLIDLLAITTMGVSVKGPDAFGQFGTGIKYGLATILRGGGEVFLSRGGKVYKFTTKTETIRGETFNIVKMNGQKLGFTDQLGKNWEPWMAFREFACNARDEGGEFYQIGDDEDWTQDALPEHDEFDVTCIAVRWDKFDEVYAHQHKLFADGEVLWEDNKLRIRAGASDHFYYRGVRAYKLEHQSAFTYDILAEQRLTEDRTLTSPYVADQIIREAVFYRVKDEQLLAGLLCPEMEGSYETRMKYPEDGATKEFLDTAMEAMDRRDRKLNASAKEVVRKSLRQSSDNYVTFGGYGGRMKARDRFTVVVEALEDCGFEMEDRKVVMVDELPTKEGQPPVLSMVEEGRIYITRDFVHQPARVIAAALVRHVMAIDCPWDSAEATLDILVPIVLDRHPDLAEKKQIGEDSDEPEPPKTLGEAEAIIRQEFLGEDLL